MKIDDLMEVLPVTYSVVDKDIIMRAYRFAEEAHSSQTRASGEPYITHCVAVAAILAELRVPPVVVIAALLHDTVEDTTVSIEDITQYFGEEAAKLVDGVTKLTHLPRVSRGDDFTGTDDDYLEVQQKSRLKDLRNETLRKTFIAMGEDIRIVLSSWRTVCIICAHWAICPNPNASASRRKPWIYLLPWQTDLVSGASNGNWKIWLFVMSTRINTKRLQKTYPKDEPTANIRLNKSWGILPNY